MLTDVTLSGYDGTHGDRLCVQSVNEGGNTGISLVLFDKGRDFFYRCKFLGLLCVKAYLLFLSR